MDYDRWDALLHHIFKQTQGDAWFRPTEESLTSGVALRINEAPPEFRVFPYENAYLEPFEAAVKKLNPFVAVKVRSAAVHAALADVPPEKSSVYIDNSTRIQVIDTMLQLPSADRDQCAAFIRDERVLVVFTSSLDTIIPTCQDFEDRLIKLLWRSRPVAGGIGVPSFQGSSVLPPGSPSFSTPPSISNHDSTYLGTGFETSPAGNVAQPQMEAKIKRNWFGKDVGLVITKESHDDKRETRLYAPVYNGLAAGLPLIFICNGLKILITEFLLDGSYLHFILVVTLPFLYCVSLFFALQIIQNFTMAFGPIAHYHTNSKYYSAIPPPPNEDVDNKLPHITIQMPVYKENLHTVLDPSFQSLKKAMQTYARQGGTSSIFVNDDGLRLLTMADRDERIAYYARWGISWVARPRHGYISPEDEVGRKLDVENGTSGRRGKAEFFIRAGRFKKASNMNYALSLSLKAESHLTNILSARRASSGGGHRASLLASNHGVSFVNQQGMPFRPPFANGPYLDSPASESSIQLGALGGTYGMQYMGKDGDDQAPSTINTAMLSGDSTFGPDSEFDEPEELALQLAMEETYQQNGGKTRPWAANGRGMRIGELILLVDSDTVVPEDCLRDGAREMATSPNLAIIQHESDVMQVAHHYFENGIAYFTRRINRCISMACANGEVAPFVGHNAFLRWSAMQDAAFVDKHDPRNTKLKQEGKVPEERIWSESNVSEDFDMALRLLLRGYDIRWATYSHGGFKEGVSLTVDDELNRWKKYAYGCSELLFNPFVRWPTRGPIAPQIRKFVWSSAPIHYKFSMLAYMFSYYGIACSVTVGVINYAFLGFMLPVDDFYMHSFEIWLAVTAVFFGLGNVAYTLLEYRLGHKGLWASLLENVTWVPFFFFFFGGLSIPLSMAILAHMFSYDIQWSATIKEVKRSNFFKEIPTIFKRFWPSLLISFLLIGGMITCSTTFVPIGWRVTGSSWGVIFPLAIGAGCHILFPIVLNPWLMVFSY